MKKGFTLVELLVVVAIIAILSVIGMAVYAGAQQKVKELKARADLDAFHKAYEMKYNLATGQYPASLEASAFVGDIPLQPNSSPYPGCTGSPLTCNLLDSGNYDKPFELCVKFSATNEYCKKSVQIVSGTVNKKYLADFSTSSGGGTGGGTGGGGGTSPSPSPTLTPVSTPVPTASPAPTASPTSSPTSSPTPTPSPTPSPSLPPFIAANTAYKRVFLTSTTYNGNLGGLSGADAKCQVRADTAGIGGSWKAWISSDSTSAAGRLTHATVPYKLLNGTTIANNWTDLTDGNLASQINIDENRSTAAGCSSNIFGAVWSNTYYDGGRRDPNYTCNNWTKSEGDSGGNYYGGYGKCFYTSSWWTFYPYSFGGSRLCTANLPIYCFEQ